MKKYTQEHIDAIGERVTPVSCAEGDYTAGYNANAPVFFLGDVVLGSPQKTLMFKDSVYFCESAHFKGPVCFDGGCSFEEDVHFSGDVVSKHRMYFYRGVSFSLDSKVTINGLNMIGERCQQAHGLGQYERTLTVWNTDKGLRFEAGCRFCEWDEFREAVVSKYDEDHEYLVAARRMAKELTGQSLE